jgi:cytochrome P450
MSKTDVLAGVVNVIYYLLSGIAVWYVMARGKWLGSSMYQVVFILLVIDLISYSYNYGVGKVMSAAGKLYVRDKTRRRIAPIFLIPGPLLLTGLNYVSIAVCVVAFIYVVVMESGVMGDRKIIGLMSRVERGCCGGNSNYNSNHGLITTAVDHIFGTYVSHNAITRERDYPGSQLSCGPHGIIDRLRNMWAMMRQNTLPIITDRCAKYGGDSQMAPVWFNHFETTVIVTNPQHLRQILSDRNDVYSMGPSPHHLDIVKPLLGYNLLTVSHDWKPVRRRVLQYLTGAHLSLHTEVMIDVMNKQFIPEWRFHARTNRPLDINKNMLMFGYYVAMKSFMNAGPLSDNHRLYDNEIVMTMYEIFNYIRGAVYDGIAKLKPSYCRFNSNKEKVYAWADDCVRRYDQSGKISADILTTHGANRQAAIEEIVSMLMVASETVVITMTWGAYYLSVWPDVQEKLRDSLNVSDPFHTTRYPTSEYLKWTLNELLRIASPSFVTDRLVLADTCLTDVSDDPLTTNKYFITKGTTIMLSQYITHRSPHVWDDPLRFNPDRWNGITTDDTRTQYFPFSYGQRSCAGSQYALREAAVCLSLLVKNFIVRSGNTIEEQQMIADGDLSSYDDRMTLRPSEKIKVMVYLKERVID